MAKNKKANIFTQMMEDATPKPREARTELDKTLEVLDNSDIFEKSMESLDAKITSGEIPAENREMANRLAFSAAIEKASAIAKRKEKRENKRNVDLSNGFEIAGIPITKDALDKLPKVTEEMNSFFNTVKLHPDHYMVLGVLVKQIQVKYLLPSKCGINQKTLVYLILQHVLANYIEKYKAATNIL
jgi:hypothetical protein